MRKNYCPYDASPRSQGWFIWCGRNAAGHARELVQGQWGLIP